MGPFLTYLTTQWWTLSAFQKVNIGVHDFFYSVLESHIFVKCVLGNFYVPCHLPGCATTWVFLNEYRRPGCHCPFLPLMPPHLPSLYHHMYICLHSFEPRHPGHVSFLHVSWHLFLKMVCPLIPASSSHSVLPLLFERMGHLTSSFCFLA